jgi:hypothetical protein
MRRPAPNKYATPSAEAHVSLQHLLSSGLLALALAGCSDLDKYKTDKNTLFRGEVVGSDSDPEQSSFIRTGFASYTKMELDFDHYAVGKDDSSGEPGRVHTYVCPPEERECSAEHGTAGPFDHDLLETIENLTHDSLSEYTFPGGGRVRNYMFGVRFDTALDDEGGTKLARNSMLFISLMDSGRVEVRAIAPSALAPDGQTEQAPALFGVFVLDRQSR